MADATVVVDFVANTRGLQKGAREAQGATSKIGSSLKGIGKAAAFGVAGAAIGGLAVALKVGIGEYQEAEKVAAQTNAVIKSTGAVAGVSAGHVNDLATSIMKKSGIDDEAIASGENLLLTFTNIRNEAGAGNDIFDQTTAAMADMATAMGTDPKSAAMQLGKALNDPVKGMAKLGKVGVTFTDAQKAAAKAMVESGDAAGAQKLILAELNKEFGGSAEAAGKTLPGQIAIAKQSFNNLAGELVGKLVPVLTQLVAWVRDHWPEISAAFATAWRIIEPLLSAFGALAAEVAHIVMAAWPRIAPVIEALVPVFRNIFAVIASVVKLVTALLRGDWSAAWDQAKAVVVNVVKLIGSILQAAAALYRAILTAAWDAIKAVTSAAWDAIKNAVASAVAWVGSELGKIPGKISGVVSRVAGAAGQIGSAIKDGIMDAIDAVVAYVGGLGGKLKSKIESAAASAGRAAAEVAAAIKRPINAVLSAWGNISVSIPRINLPNIPGTDFGGGSYGGQSWHFPKPPLLAKGGVLTQPTLFIGGESGREIVAPETLLRQLLREEGGGDTFQLNLTATQADAADVAWGFRRLELLRTGR